MSIQRGLYTDNNIYYCRDKTSKGMETMVNRLTRIPTIVESPYLFLLPRVNKLKRISTIVEYCARVHSQVVSIN